MRFRPVAMVAMLVGVTLLLYGCGSDTGESISANWTGFQSPVSTGLAGVEFVPQVSSPGPGQKIQLSFLIRASSPSSSSTTKKVVTLSSALGALIEPYKESTTYSRILAATTASSNAVLQVDDKGMVTCSYTAPRVEGIDLLTITGDGFQEAFPLAIQASAALRYAVTVTPAQASLAFGDRTLVSVTVVRSDGALPTGSLFMHTSLGGRLLKTDDTGSGDTAAVFAVTSGKASVFYVAGNVAQTDTISASFGTASTSVSIAVGATSSVNQITLTSTVSSLKTSEQALLAIEANGAGGKPVSGNVLLSSSLGGVFRKPGEPTTDITVISLESGKASVLFEAGPFSGTTVISAAIPGASASLPIAITSQPLYLLELVPESTSLASGTTMGILVRIRTRKGLPVDSGQSIRVSTTIGTLEKDPASGSALTLTSVTDIQTLTYRADQAGTAVIRATSANAGEAVQTITITN